REREGPAVAAILVGAPADPVRPDSGGAAVVELVSARALGGFGERKGGGERAGGQGEHARAILLRHRGDPFRWWVKKKLFFFGPGARTSRGTSPLRPRSVRTPCEIRRASMPRAARGPPRTG